MELFRIKKMAIFLIPAALFMSLFLIYPIVLLIHDSFYKFADDGVTSFIGFGNYTKAFTSARFWGTVENTVVYVVAAVSIEFILGLLLAALFSAEFFGNKVIRTILLTPLMIAPLVAGLIWKFMLSSQFGIVNYFLVKIGVLANVNDILWLSSKPFALISCCIADIWLTTPFMMLVLLAGINGIDKSVLESASIDGSSKISTFFRVMIPCMMPVIIVGLTIRVIDAARTFDIIWVMTQGGPQFSTELLSTYIYKTLTRYGNIGYASAMSVIFVGILIGITLIFRKKLWNPENN